MGACEGWGVAKLDGVAAEMIRANEHAPIGGFVHTWRKWAHDHRSLESYPVSVVGSQGVHTKTTPL